MVKELSLPFPQVEFQPLLTEIAALKPDVVYAFFAGGGAVKFVKDYAAAGLNKTIPLVGPGFLTDGTLEAQGDSAQGLLTTLHYGDGLNNPKNNAFRAAYMKAFKVEPDVYAVQGYDAAQLLDRGRQRGEGRHVEARRDRQGDGDREDRQPARPVRAQQGAQPDPRHLPAQGRGQGEQGDRRRGQEPHRSAARLQALIARLGVRMIAIADACRRRIDVGARDRADATAKSVAMARMARACLHARDCVAPMDIYTFLIQLLNGVQYGLLLFLVASGLTLIFGIMGIINLAHGSFYMVGAYMAFTLSSLTGNLFVAIVVGIVLSVLLGIVLEWALISHLYKRDHLEQVLLTYGLILVFEELRSLIVGNDVHGVAGPGDPRRVDPADGDACPIRCTGSFMSAVCLALAGLLYLLIHRTRVGMMIRAGASNREMVSALGLNINLVYRLVFALGVALAAFAGMIAAPVSSVYPGMGTQVLIICFVVVVIGGIGSIWGALVASLLIGLADTFGKVLVPEAAGVTVYLLMAAILLWRPEGLFKRVGG